VEPNLRSSFALCSLTWDVKRWCYSGIGVAFGVDESGQLQIGVSTPESIPHVWTYNNNCYGGGK